MYVGLKSIILESDKSFLVAAMSHITFENLLSLRAFAKHFRQNELRLNAASQAGPRLSKKRGRGMVFEEVREYQPGDDIRHMDWRVTARIQSPHVKVYREEKDCPVWLWINLSPSTFFGTKRVFKSVALCELTSLIGWVAVERGDNVGAVLVYNDEITVFPLAAREQTVLPLLKTLAHATLTRPRETSADTVQDSLHRLRMLSHAQGQCFLLSDFYDLTPQHAAPLLALNASQQATAIQIDDPLETTPPPFGDYAISDGEQMTTLAIRSTAQQNTYLETVTQRQQGVETCLAKAQIPLWSISTADNPVKALQRYW